MAIPPLTAKVSPVINPASSDTRKATAAATSDRNNTAPASRIVDQLITETSALVTVIYGSDAHGHAELEHRITASHPSVDVVMYDGGQPHWPYLIGVE